jgi:hypothetical protein
MAHAALEKLVLDRRREPLPHFKIPRIVRIVDDFSRALLKKKVARNKLQEVANNL